MPAGGAAASLGAEVKDALCNVAWVLVFILAVWLRFEHLGQRPIHCDEATGARITAKRLEAGDYRFDPAHFHGPTLSCFAMAACAFKGETRWAKMSKGTLRWVPAVAGVLAALAPWLGRRRWGHGPMLLAAASLAVSPLLVYYSRMFIHEMLLVLFGLLTLAALAWDRRGRSAFLLGGLWTGFMFATKETFVISLLAWGGAACLVWWEERAAGRGAALPALWREHGISLLLGVLVAFATAALFYTDWFRKPEGLWDALRTYFVYQTTDGHEKGWDYYFRLLCWPKKSGGLWWSEAGALVLAVGGYAASFGAQATLMRWRRPVRFLAYAAAGHFLIYLLIRYKTPWLMCLPWAHVCLLGGFGAALLLRRGPVPLRWGYAALALVLLAWQGVQARQATGRLASDDRNPYAYVPTSGDIEGLDAWLRQIGSHAPQIPLEPMGVVGSGYWPLPWYLGGFEKIGYWAAPPPELERMPVVFAAPDALDAVSRALARSHTPVLRGLRSEEPLAVFVRNDLWKLWVGGPAQ